MPETAEEKRRRILLLARESISKAYSTGEHSLMQAVNAYNELERTRNLLQERLEEWYGIYFPEFIASPEQYARFVIDAGSNKKEASGDTLAKLFGDKSDSVMEKIKSSIGNEPSAVEYAALKNLAAAELELIKVEKEIDAYLMENVPKAMPNVSYLIDYKLAAELLSRAGSLTKLANMPASTVQLLGAEKALFRHLRSGSRAPKYGVLFRLKDVTTAERWNKGRVARMFAAKLSIAARADAFSKRFIGDILKASLEKSLANMPEERKDRPERPAPAFEHRREQRYIEPRARDDRRQEPRAYERDDRQTRVPERAQGQERRYDQTRRPPWQGRPSGPKRYAESESRRPQSEVRRPWVDRPESGGRRPWQERSSGQKRYERSEGVRPWQARSYNKRPISPEIRGPTERKPRDQENRSYGPQGSRDYRSYRPQRPQERGEREYRLEPRKGGAYRPQRYGQKEYQEREPGHYRRPQSEERGPSGFRPHMPRSDRSRAPSAQHRGYKKYKRGRRV